MPFYIQLIDKRLVSQSGDLVKTKLLPFDWLRPYPQRQLKLDRKVPAQMKELGLCIILCAGYIQLFWLESEPFDVVNHIGKYTAI